MSPDSCDYVSGLNQRRGRRLLAGETGGDDGVRASHTQQGWICFCKSCVCFICSIYFNVLCLHDTLLLYMSIYANFSMFNLLD